MGLALEVYARVDKEAEPLRFTNIIGNLAREQILMGTIKSTCSRIRNSFRESVSLPFTAVLLTSNTLQAERQCFGGEDEDAQRVCVRSNNEVPKRSDRQLERQFKWISMAGNICKPH